MVPDGAGVPMRWKGLIGIGNGDKMEKDGVQKWGRCHTRIGKGLEISGRDMEVGGEKANGIRGKWLGDGVLGWVRVVDWGILLNGMVRVASNGTEVGRGRGKGNIVDVAGNRGEETGGWMQ